MKITIPTSWDEITIGQYREVLAIPQQYNNITQKIHLIAILANCTLEHVRQLPPQAFNDIQRALKFTAKLPSKFAKQLTIRKHKYVLVDFSTMKVGEWADIAEYELKPAENLHKLLAIIYREKVKGKVQPYAGANKIRQADMDKLSMAKAYGASVFFSIFASELYIITKGYSQEQILTMAQNMINTQQQNGVGTA